MPSGEMGARSVAETQAIFRLPVGSVSLVYAPLHGLTAVMQNRAAERLRAALSSGGRRGEPDDGIDAIAAHLRGPAAASPAPRTGDLRDPLFLGIIPTRGCTMACSYCDFLPPAKAGAVMDADVAGTAVDGYLALLAAHDRGEGAIHFFGGEPFHAPSVVEFVVEYAAYRAAAAGIRIHFEATTNGMFGAARAEWIADHFDCIVLSLDGPPAVQDRQRPTKRGRASFTVVERAAKVLSEGAVELIIRSCVTDDSVDRLAEWAAWISEELRPSAVCFECLTTSPRTAAAGLRAPDPYRFALSFAQAARILESRGIDAVQSMSDTSSCRITACPVGRDALIVSPDGAIDACYLLRSERREHGIDLRLGRVDVRHGRLDVDADALDRSRALPARDKPLCADCYCRYHCAGGCHVSHDTGGPPGAYDDTCLATRLITADKLLRRLGLGDLALESLADTDSAVALATQAGDRLCSFRGA